MGSKDNKKNIIENLQIVKRKISNQSKKVFLLSQFHSNKVIFIGKDYKSITPRPKADCVITDQRKLPIGVLTADCVPILLYDKKKKIIAAVHAGWKGAYKNIIGSVIKLMTKKGCEIKNITAVIGPSIAFKSYEVKEHFKKKFLKKDNMNKVFFKEKNNKIYFNLKAYLQSSIQGNNVKNIEILNIDTFDVKNNFFSARRSLTLKEKDYGRNISIIMIN